MYRLVRGAGNETRTRDLLLGKETLYQLSYSREYPDTQSSYEITMEMSNIMIVWFLYVLEVFYAQY